MIKLSKPNISESGIEAVCEILRSGDLVHGAASENFEAALCDYLKVKHALLVSSGTAALHLALLSLNIGKGDAVLAPDFTFPATFNAIRLTGATPVVVDVSPETYCIDPEQIEKIITAWAGPEKLKAILPVHEFGQVAPMREIQGIARENNLKIIEDAACALGAAALGKRAGSLGAIGCFSFHPRKTLTTGEGGAVVTDDPELANAVRELRNHGISKTSNGITFSGYGLNYRLTQFQAALGLSQLSNLDSWISKRRSLASLYRQALKGLEANGFLLCPADSNGHSWQTFMVVLDSRFDRDEVIRRMRERGIESNLGAQSQTWLSNPQDNIAAPIGHRLYRSGLALPFCESYGPETVDLVTSNLTEVLYES